MQKLLIKGKKYLSGSIKISGSKNATLPILAAAILCEKIVLKNIPLVKDVFTMIELLNSIGLSVKLNKKNLFYRFEGFGNFPSNGLHQSKKGVTRFIWCGRRFRYSLVGSKAFSLCCSLNKIKKMSPFRNMPRLQFWGSEGPNPQKHTKFRQIHTQ